MKYKCFQMWIIKIIRIIEAILIFPQIFVLKGNAINIIVLITEEKIKNYFILKKQGAGNVIVFT